MMPQLPIKSVTLCICLSVCAFLSFPPPFLILPPPHPRQPHPPRGVSYTGWHVPSTWPVGLLCQLWVKAPLRATMSPWPGSYAAQNKGRSTYNIAGVHRFPMLYQKYYQPVNDELCLSLFLNAILCKRQGIYSVIPCLLTVVSGCTKVFPPSPKQWRTLSCPLSQKLIYCNTLHSLLDQFTTSLLEWQLNLETYSPWLVNVS